VARVTGGGQISEFFILLLLKELEFFVLRLIFFSVLISTPYKYVGNTYMFYKFSKLLTSISQYYIDNSFHIYYL
jgi:hypothetical protein